MIFIDSRFATARRSAFTLVEVMVSIAVALLLLLGVNQVFHATAVTTGVGLALSTSQQMSRTVKATLQDDLKNGAWDTGILIIRNEQVYAFRNAADQQSAADPNNPAKPDPALASAFPNGVYPAYTVNSRSHRVDRIGFFARGLFDRQTSPGPMDTVAVQGTEAWVWYGHLALPNNNLVKTTTFTDWINPSAPAAYFGPGAPNSGSATNDNNFFATDWALGRFATLLLGTDQSVMQSNRDSMQTCTGNSPNKPAYSSPALAPLTFDSVSATNVHGISEVAQESLHDAAQESIARYTARLANFVTTNGNSASGVPWYYAMIGVNATSSQFVADARYQASPFIPSVGLDGGQNPSRLSPTSLALAAPIVGRGCCHFIVEYAGNYLTQVDAPSGKDSSNRIDGTVLSASPSSNPDHIDYVSILDPTTNQYVRKIRWYGFPRNTNGIPGIQYDDVLPLRDVLALNGVGTQAQFEHFGQNFPIAPNAGQVPTSGPATSQSLTEYDAPGSQPDYSYTCAWGPFPAVPPIPPGMAAYGLPKLLRITVVFDDPNGRLGTEQSYEYIIDLRN